MAVEAIGIFTLDDVDDRIRRNDVFEEVLLSKEVDPTDFAVKIKFQRSDDQSLKWLTCSITNINRKIADTTVMIKLVDVNLKVLGLREHVKKLSGFNEQLCGLQFSLNRLSNRGLVRYPSDTVYLHCIIRFVSIPGTNGASSSKKAFRDSTLSEDLLQWFELGEDTDVSIRVGDESFHAHKSILAARSVYFRSLFRSGMAETISNEIKIEDADPRAFKELLRFLYSGLLPNDLGAIAMSLLPLADRFGALALKELCVTAVEKAVKVETVIDAFSLAQSHSCPSLNEKCLAFIKANRQTLKTTESWKRLKSDHQLAVVVLDALCD